MLTSMVTWACVEDIGFTTYVGLICGSPNDVTGHQIIGFLYHGNKNHDIVINNMLTAQCQLTSYTRVTSYVRVVGC